MNKDAADRHEPWHDLRERAEQHLPQPGVDTGEMSADEVARLVHELEIHQEELEIQNEELRRAHLELKDSRDRYLDLYDFAPVGYLTVDANSEIIEANLTTCDMLGYERSRLIGMRLALFCDVGSRAGLSAHLNEVLTTGNRQRTELRFTAAATFDAQLEMCRSRDPKNNDHYQCRTVMTDITAGKQAERLALEKDRLLQMEVKERQFAEDRLRAHEKQLAHFARVHTMGEMVAGIAHEINQPLCAISNFATACELQLQQRGRDQNEEVLRMMRQIAEQAVRSGEIIKRLRAFVTKAETSRTAIRIQDVIDESVQLTATEARQHNVTVRLSLEDKLQDVVADRVQIQQVLVNLMNNAYDAFASVDGERFVTIRASAIDDGIDVAVEDMGEGLLPEIADSVFDPFLSTKADGMGLGLAISRSIVEAHGGKIWATPNSQRGTAFHFTLPIANKAATLAE